MQKKSKNGCAVPIGSVLRDVLKTCGRQADRDMLQVWDCWDDAMDDPLASNAQPAAVKGGILLIYVSSPVWIQHLSFKKQDIIERLNTALGETLVHDLKFKVGPLKCHRDDP